MEIIFAAINANKRKSVEIDSLSSAVLGLVVLICGEFFRFGSDP